MAHRAARRALAVGFAVAASPFFGLCAHAEEPAPAAQTAPFSGHAFASNAREVVTRPFHLDRKGKARLAAVGATTLALYGLRHEIRNEIQEHPSEERADVLSSARTMGKAAFAPAVALVAFSVGRLTDDRRGDLAASLLLQSAAWSAFAAGLGSFVLSTERPRDGDDIAFFRTGGHGVSLDAALAASVVVPLRRIYLRVEPDDSGGRRAGKRTASALLYSGAILTALQRIESDAHWAPDAFLGVATGLSVGGVLCDAAGVPRTRGADVAVVPARRGAAILVTIPLRAPRRNRPSINPAAPGSGEKRSPVGREAPGRSPSSTRTRSRA